MDPIEPTYYIGLSNSFSTLDIVYCLVLVNVLLVELFPLEDTIKIISLALHNDSALLPNSQNRRMVSQR